MDKSSGDRPAIQPSGEYRLRSAQVRKKPFASSRDFFAPALAILSLSLLVLPTPSFSQTSPIARPKSFLQIRPASFDPRKRAAVSNRYTGATFEFEARRSLAEMTTPRALDGRPVPSVVSRVWLQSTSFGSAIVSGRLIRVAQVSLVANSRLPGADVLRTREFIYAFDPVTTRLLMRSVQLATAQQAAAAQIPYLPARKGP